RLANLLGLFPAKNGIITHFFVFSSLRKSVSQTAPPSKSLTLALSRQGRPEREELELPEPTHYHSFYSTGYLKCRFQAELSVWVFSGRRGGFCPGPRASTKRQRCGSCLYFQGMLGYFLCICCI